LNNFSHDVVWPDHSAVPAHQAYLHTGGDEMAVKVIEAVAHEASAPIALACRLRSIVSATLWSAV
jgi:hypothetical protein